MTSGWRRIISCLCCLPSLSYVPYLLIILSLTETRALELKVCQNKDCCRRFHGQSTLPRILKDLDLQVTTTGCLSLCQKGPNVVVTRSDGDKVYLHGLADPIAVLVALEPITPVSSKLKAAIQVMEQGQKGTSACYKCN
jgi:hypothetical protein